MTPERIEALANRVKFRSNKNKRFGGKAAGMNVADRKGMLTGIIAAFALDCYPAPPPTRRTWEQKQAIETAFAAVEENVDLFDSYIARYETLRFLASDGT